MNGPRKRMYLLHRWTGLLLAMLGTLVFFSGAVVTFHEEIEAWATRGDRVPPLAEIEGFDLDAAWAVASHGVDARYLHEVDVAKPLNGPLAFFMHEHVTEGGAVSEVGVYRLVDPRSGELLVSRTGSRDAVMEPLPKAALAQFFVDLHFFLLMPRTLGLIVTGVVGFGLTVLIGTGVFIHRPTWAKLTRKPRVRRLRSLLGDLHTHVGSWTLPYTIVLALTGTFFSLATTVLIPVVAMVAFGGDQAALIRTIVGQTEVSESSAVARLDPMLRDAGARTEGGHPRFIALAHWGQEDASAVFFMRTPSSLGDVDRNLVYDGHSGEFLQTKPLLGTKPSLGGFLFKLMGDLHFGTLAGTLTKVLWAMFGLATCLIACSGLLVFCARNEGATHPGIRVVRAMIVALVGGLPLATPCAALTWVTSCAVGAPDPMLSMTWVFLLTLVLIGMSGALIDLHVAIVASWAGAAAAFLVLPLVGPHATGRGVVAAWADVGTRSTIAVDLACFTIGLGLGCAAWIWHRRRAIQVAAAVPMAQ